MQKRNFTRRATAVLLAAVMILSIFTTTGSAFATDEAPYAYDYTQNKLPGQLYDGTPEGYPACEHIAIPPLNDPVRVENPERFNGVSETDGTDLKVNCYKWKQQITGNFYSLNLISAEHGNMTAIIAQCPAVRFYATSNNSTVWEIVGPVTVQDGYTHVPPNINLSKASILVIERLPFQAEDSIKWVGFAIMENTLGDIWREQIRIQLNGVWLNPLPPEPATAITGLNGFDWAREAVEFVVARDLINMYMCAETNELIDFNPNGDASRGYVLAAAVKALGLTAPDFPDSTHTPFYDVPLYGRGIYIDIAKQLGLVAGVGDNKFAPDLTITRQDMMTMLYNIMMAMGQIQPDTGLTALGRFNDLGQIDSHARLPISSLARAGIIAGNGVSINPRGYINRVEAAMFVRNLYRVAE